MTANRPTASLRAKLWPHGRAFSIGITTAMLAVAGSVVAGADDSDRATVSPDADMQAALAAIADAEAGQARMDAINRLAELDKPPHHQLIRQLVYFASRADSTKEAMAAGVIIRQLDIPDISIARALVPCLDTEDRAVSRSVRNVLGGIEGRSADRRPDFSTYREIIAECLRSGGQPTDGLVRYMYDADAGMALLAMMRAHQWRQPERIKEILWAEHAVSDVLWKQRFGFMESDEVDPEVAQELAKLTSHESWWVRFYVAEVMRQHAAFRSPALIRTLSHDTAVLVRESVARIEQGPSLNQNRATQP